MNEELQLLLKEYNDAIEMANTLCRALIGLGVKVTTTVTIQKQLFDYDYPIIVTDVKTEMPEEV